MGTDREEKMPFVMPVRPRNLVWVLVLAACWIAVSLYGTPHLRVQYEWNGRAASPWYFACDYWGVTSFRHRPMDGHCPLFLLAHAERRIDQ